MTSPFLLVTEPIPGMRVAQDILTPEEESDWIARIDAAGLELFPDDGRRSNSWGLKYNRQTREFDRCGTPPEVFRPLRQIAAQFVGNAADDFTELLVIRYDPGARIDWHFDSPIFDRVVGISLGEKTPMRFRRKRPNGYDEAEVDLQPRSIYVLSGEARHDFEHSIAPVAGTRWSVTLRTLTEEGRRKVEAGARLTTT